jgi:hypothetical protein
MDQSELLIQYVNIINAVSTINTNNPIVDYTIEQKLYDVKLRCEDDKVLYFWRKLLVLHSEYFEAMFNSSMTESKSNEIICKQNSKPINLFLNYVHIVSSGKLNAIPGLITNIVEDGEVYSEAIEIAEQYRVISFAAILDQYFQRDLDQYLCVEFINFIINFPCMQMTQNKLIRSILGDSSVITCDQCLHKLSPDVFKFLSKHCNSGNYIHSYYVLLCCWLKADEKNSQYLSTLMPDEIINMTNVQHDHVLYEMCEYASDDLKLKIYDKIASNYMKYRRAVNTMVSIDEISLAVRNESKHENSVQLSNRRTNTSVVNSSVINFDLVETKFA